MANRLRQLEIRRVDLVDRGANPDAHVVLYKRDDTSDREHPDARFREDQSREGEVAKNKDGRPDLSGAGDDVVKYVETLEARATDAETRVSDLEKAKTELDTRVADLEKSVAAKADPEDVVKALPEDVRKRFEELEKRTAEAEAVAKAERETRERAEAIAKAREIGIGDAEKVGEVLRKADPDDRAVIEETLKAAAEQLKQSALFKEQGTSTSTGGGAAETKLESLAKSYAAEKGVSYHKAYDEVLRTDEGRRLYQETLDERKGGSR